MHTSAPASETPVVLSLEKRPFHIGQLSEFVHHLGADVEFLALDLDGAEYGGITRLQMIELLKMVQIPDCSICHENHGRPVLDSFTVRQSISRIIRDWWNDGLRQVWREQLEIPETRHNWFQDLSDTIAKLAVEAQLLVVRDWTMTSEQTQRVIDAVVRKHEYRKGVSFSWAHVVEAAVEEKIVVPVATSKSA